MRRRAKPAKAEVEATSPARKSRKNEGSEVRDLEKRLAEALEQLQTRDRELVEALEQQTATSEILRVISSSPTDLQHVLDAVAQSAARLCHANDALIYRLEGERLELVAKFGQVPYATEGLPLTRGLVTSRAVIDRQTLHIEDLAAELDEFPDAETYVRRFSHRTILATPLLREGLAIGAIAIRRTEVRPFLDNQVDLLKTFADQAVIAIENVRLFKELEARNRDLTESLDQQTATSEILQVISGSPTDIRPVLDAVCQSATQLCEAYDAMVSLREGEALRVAAHHGPILVPLAVNLRPISRDWVMGRAVADRQSVHVADLLAAGTEFPLGRADAVAAGHRTTLAVPLMREDEAIGVILIRRLEVLPFSDRQVALLKTFADQAVIAIENVRLFKELEARNRELTTALEQQTATSEVLRVISRSQADIQPVYDTIVQNAVRLCGAEYGNVYRFDGELIHFVAGHNLTAAQLDHWRRTFPRPLNVAGDVTRAIATGRVVRVEDIEADPERVTPEILASLRARGIRSILIAPMLRRNEVIGAIGLNHREVGAFSDAHVELLKTFADQAVIAIENVRLFKELESRNKDLTEALDQQTATSEILRVISSSPTDVQPVFDTIVTSAGRLCGAESAVVYRFEEEMADAVALYNLNPDAIEAYHRRFPRRLRDTDYLWRVADGSVLNIADIANDPHTATNETFRSRDVHSFVLVPMVRDEQAIGAIRLSHHDVGAFSEERVRLLKTFAAQAVLAIENVRLLSELRARTAQLTRSVEELTALGEVSRALSSTLNLETVLRTIVLRANELAGTAGCTIWEYDETHEEFRLRASHYADEGDAALLQAPGRVTTIPRGQGVTTQVMERRQPVQIHDITTARDYESPIRRPLIEAGHRGLLGVPLLSEDQVIGVLAVTCKTAGEFEPEIVRLLSTFATQSALAIQNARLFLEIEDKSRQLEAASQHKSEFLANMSHELRTPLNAIIGFSEVLSERMFGDLNEKQEEYLKDIYASGTHLLSLINDILDLSKIEAGRMELELTDFDLPQAIDNALILVRERAGRRGVALEHSVDERLGEIRGDERKVKQVLLNLLSNALKFTLEGGRVEVRAGMVDGMAEISVTDTGVGIAPEDQEAVFEEFRQVGTSAAKQEGTGLGLALCRKFVELHGGKIWVQSEVGRGSTFTFTIPVRRGE